MVAVGLVLEDLPKGGGGEGGEVGSRGVGNGRSEGRGEE